MHQHCFILYKLYRQINIVTSLYTTKEMQFMSTLRQSYNQTTKKQKQQKKTHPSNKFTTYSKPMTHHRLYYIDSIYEGTVNSSHYRQGFGIMQTLNFHTFLGNFKNGRAEGLGLVILNSGTRIYGNFIKDQLTGIALIENKKLLKLGVWNKFQLNGIGYQYDYEKYLWKMVRFWKGSVAEIIKEEACNLNDQMPTLINMQHSLYFFLLNFIEGNYFPLKSSSHLKSQSQQGNQNQNSGQHFTQNSQKNYIHIQMPQTVHFGQLKQGLETGIGVKYDKNDKCVSQAGFYQNGKLHGYGLKFNCTIKHREIGLYGQGKKEGLFMHDDSGKISYCLYHNNMFLETLELAGRQFLRKKQKQHNYSKKSFISQKNTLDLDIVCNAAEKICMTSQGAENPKIQNQAKKQLDKILKKGQYDELKSKISVGKDQVMLTDADKTSASLLKEKFKYFQGYEQLTFDEAQIEAGQRMQSVSKSRINQNSTSEEYQGRVRWEEMKARPISRQNIRKNNQNREGNEPEQIPIAEQENPFDVEEKSTGKFIPHKIMNNHFRNQR